MIDATIAINVAVQLKHIKYVAHAIPAITRSAMIINIVINIIVKFPINNLKGKNP